MSDASVRTWGDHGGPVLDAARGFDVIHCGRCGFRHVVPVPTPEELDQVYREDYYAVEKPLYIERYQEDLDWWNLVYDERYDLLESLLPAERRGLLDVGSGPGFFLQRGRARGWRCVGIEPSVQSAEFSSGLGLDIVREFLTPATAAALGRFDVAHLSNVLEHLPDPAGMIALVRGLLDPGGVLFIVVPNDYNPFQEALRAQGMAPWWVAPPHHINYFDFATLQGLLERCGFEVVDRQTTFPMELFLMMGDNYVGDDQLGRRCHARRKNLERALAAPSVHGIKQTLYRGLADLGVGREIVMAARLKA